MLSLLLLDSCSLPLVEILSSVAPRAQTQVDLHTKRLVGLLPFGCRRCVLILAQCAIVIVRLVRVIFFLFEIFLGQLERDKVLGKVQR